MKPDSLSKPRVLIVAAECRDLAKVGGLADVVRDLSKALLQLGVPVRVVMPCYDVIRQPRTRGEQYDVLFGSQYWTVDVFVCELDGVPVYLLRNDDFFGGHYGDVYVSSDLHGGGPFEDDAKRFAFFSAAVIEWLRLRADHDPVDALHCHDWHTGSLLVLLRHDDRYRSLASTLQTLFTIHNLDYQGTRPFESFGGKELTTFAGWFPGLYGKLKWGDFLYPIASPHDPNAFNPMRAGLNLAHNVNTVSPTYALEITQPDEPFRNFKGGRGLQADLKCALGQGRLHAILNGLDYSLNDPSRLEPPYDADIKQWTQARRTHRQNLIRSLPDQIQQLALELGPRFWNRDKVLSRMAGYVADDWLGRPLVVAVTRAAAQKVSILLEPVDGSTAVWEEILRQDISLLILGSGELQEQLNGLNDHPNGLFVGAFDPAFAQNLYAGGDLFLMPSDFEPCGLSQMIAMRYGCLPLVHDIGGLHDTVTDMETGFVYGGESRQLARLALVETLKKAIDTYAHHPRKWQAMQRKAMSLRFEWISAAEQYLRLYERHRELEIS